MLSHASCEFPVASDQFSVVFMRNGGVNRRLAVERGTGNGTWGTEKLGTGNWKRATRNYNTQMRLAWFSPMPPVPSGVATVSAELVRELGRRHVIDVYVHATHPPQAIP